MTYMLRHVVIQYQDYRGYSMTYRVCHNVVFNKNPLNRIFFIPPSISFPHFLLQRQKDFSLFGRVCSKGSLERIKK